MFGPQIPAGYSRPITMQDLHASASPPPGSGLPDYHRGKRLWYAVFEAEFPAPSRISLMPVYFQAWTPAPSRAVSSPFADPQEADETETGDDIAASGFVAICKLHPVDGKGSAFLGIPPERIFPSRADGLSWLRSSLERLRRETGEAIAEHTRLCGLFLEDCDFLVAQCSTVAAALAEE